MRASTETPARSRPARTRLLAVAACVFMLAGCVSDGSLSTHNRGLMGGSGAQTSGESETGHEATGYWGDRYASNPGDKANILGYAGALRRNDQLDQAREVLRKGVIKHRKDREIAAAYGKILAQNGRFKEALNVIQQAQTPTRPDWKLMSAEAAIHDQLGDHTRARRMYTETLKIVPGEPSVLNNLAMSYVLEDDLDTAEKILRTAMERGKPDTRIRQNLALVLGLQGRFAEAEQVASADLPPAQVKANMAYLKRMLAQRGQATG